MLAKL